MRIRKRPPAAAEAARAADPVMKEKEKVSNILGVRNGEPLTRIVGGRAELPRVVSEVLLAENLNMFIRADAGEEAKERRDHPEHVECEEAQNGNVNKHEYNETGAELLMNGVLLLAFERTGNRGLTAREAVAKLVAYDLPGLQDGNHERSTVQVAKVLRTPDFVHLEDGTYYLQHGAHSTPHAVVAETSTQSESSQQHAVNSQPREDASGNSPGSNSGKRKRGATKHAKTAVAQQISDGSKDKTSEISNTSIGLPLNEKVELKKRRRRPPSSQHELAIGPRQCKRYDGRGWQCTRETEEGFSFCEHHQALMNKRTLRLEMAKMRRKGPLNIDINAEAEPHQGSSDNSNQVREKQADAEVENVEHTPRRRVVKARSLKSIK